MTFDELESIERREKMHDAREERKLLPVDSNSQLDTGYTGRSDCDMKAQGQRLNEKLRPRWCGVMNPVPIEYKGSSQYACCILFAGHHGPHKAAAVYGLKEWSE
jgi:hypothetical protein